MSRGCEGSFTEQQPFLAGWEKSGRTADWPLPCPGDRPGASPCKQAEWGRGGMKRAHSGVRAERGRGETSLVTTDSCKQLGSWDHVQTLALAAVPPDSAHHTHTSPPQHPPPHTCTHSPMPSHKHTHCPTYGGISHFLPRHALTLTCLFPHGHGQPSFCPDD